MRPLLPLLAGSLVAAAVFTLAVAQSAAPSVGAQVRDSKGQIIGVVEKVVYAGDRARQVLIRQGSALRTLPIDGLTAQNGGYVTVLSKAEFDALPTQ